MNLLLIIVTIIDGFVIAESLLFLALELTMNVAITIDLASRMKITGLKKFFRSNSGKLNWWNVFDTFMVVTCVLLFIAAILIQHGPLKDADLGIESFVMVVWAVW